jgi:hypothetical protein
MINPFTEVNWNPGPAEKRKFALSLAIGFPIVAAVLFLVKGLVTHTWNPVPSYWIGGIGLALGLLLLAVRVLAKPFYLVWHFLGCCVGIVVSNALMAGFFFTVVTLTGLLLRLLGRQPLQKRFNKKATTYWIDAERATGPKRYYRQF